MRETVSIDINDFVIMHKWNSKENYSILHVTIALKNKWSVHEPNLSNECYFLPSAVHWNMYITVNVNTKGTEVIIRHTS